MNTGAAIVVVVAVIVLVTGAFVLGRDKGRGEILAEIEEDSAQAEKDRDKIDGNVAGRPDEQIDKDLDKWHRD